MLNYRLTAKSLKSIDTLRNLCIDSNLPIEVSRMAQLEDEQCDRERWRSPSLESGLTLLSDRHCISKIRGFSIWFGPFCEPMVLGLSQTPDQFIFEGTCATWGEDVPLEIFELRHLTACKALKLAAQANILAHVSDETNFWKSRKLSDLKKSVLHIKSMIDNLKDVDFPQAEALRQIYGGQFTAKLV
jgi:hypothetical protein